MLRSAFAHYCTTVETFKEVRRLQKHVAQSAETDPSRIPDDQKPFAVPPTPGRCQFAPPKRRTASHENPRQILIGKRRNRPYARGKQGNWGMPEILEMAWIRLD